MFIYMLTHNHTHMCMHTHRHTCTCTHTDTDTNTDTLKMPFYYPVSFYDKIFFVNLHSYVAMW